MNNDVESEILFHILDEFKDRNVDARQLLNHVTPEADGFVLRAYGVVLRFNSDGDRL